jgi:signal peptidase
MQHSDDISSVGVIDTGDLVFVKKLGEDQTPVSYVEGQKKDHRTYSSYGDVIIFRPNGDENKTAIIHRAVVWIEFNATTYDNVSRSGGSFDIPSLGLRDVTGQVTIPNYEWPQKPSKMDLSIDISAILRNFRNYRTTPHSGFVTKGDDNLGVDQTSDFFNPEPPWIEPVKKDWIIGKSVGELPWFGIIKLKFEDNDHNNDIHSNSERNLWIALIVIVATPFAIDFLIHMVVRAVKSDIEVKDEEKVEEPPKRKRVAETAPKKKSYIDLGEKKGAEKGPRKAPSPPGKK